MSEGNERTPLLNKVGDAKKDLPKEFHRKHFKKHTPVSTLREPYVINSSDLSRNASLEALSNHAQYNRYRYYSKINHLAGNKQLTIPDHVLPRQLFWPFVASKGEKQSSLITIFAIWNTMMGTSILSLPWALQQSGFALGISLLVVMGIVCLYTCLLIVKSTDGIKSKETVEFVDVCYKELGNPGWYLAFVIGNMAILGAVIVYWVLLTNFLFQIGTFIHDHIKTVPNNASHVTAVSSHEHSDVLCFVPTFINSTDPHSLVASSTFYKYWNKRKTVPFYLLAMLVPLSSLKSPTFFTKLNSLGTISVLYILSFVTVKSVQWGFHLHFNVPQSEAPSKLMNSNFPTLTGILALGYYIHNAILSILATNKKPEKNSRDVSVAYSLTALTYGFIAVLFYTCFPMDKACIAQVFLDNFVATDIMAFVARCCLLFQMFTVFPLLMYIIRVQVLTAVLKTSEWSYLSIIVMNLLVITCGVLMAVFYPEVGHIIRYVGSLSGMVYIFTLPSLVVMIKNRRSKKYQQRWKEMLSITFYSFIILCGVLNFIAQFFVRD